MMMGMAMGLEKLRGDMMALLDDPKFSDVVIKVQAREIHVHAAILASRSAYFSAMLGSEFREKKEGCIEITDFTADTIMGMLRFIYGASPPELTSTSACELMKAADKYQLNELKEVCEDFLFRRLNSENALNILYHAETCSFHTLKKKSLDFVSRNMGSFHNREMRYLITRNAPELAEEIFERLAEKASPPNREGALSQVPVISDIAPTFKIGAASDNSLRSFTQPLFNSAVQFGVPSSQNLRNSKRFTQYLNRSSSTPRRSFFRLTSTSSSPSSPTRDNPHSVNVSGPQGGSCGGKSDSAPT